MASRLDRLFILLETGSNTITRKTAAIQLGSIVRIHPEEIWTLLSRLSLCLKSSSWETRIAAGAAVEACLKEWKDHREVASGSGSEEGKPTNIKLEPIEDGGKINCVPKEEVQWYYEPQDKIQHYITALINPSYEKLLMGSEGSNYDRITKLDEAKQKQMLSKQLVGPLPSDVLNVEELVTEQDFAENNHHQRRSSNDSEGSEDASGLRRSNSVGNNSGSSSSQEIQPQQLTSRQLNQLKRRAKKPVTHQQSEEREKKPKLIEVTNITQWVNSLLEDLFSLEWETRHGAATGLREFFRACGGDLDYILRDGETVIEKSEWISSTSLTLIKVLAFDRFGDFVSDQVIAPVRETVAQCLGALYCHMSIELVNDMVSILISLVQNEKVWEMRHGGLLALKYILAVRKDLSSKIIPHTFSAILRRLKDNYDDVVTVAASGLVPVVEELIKYVDRPSIQELLEILWGSLKNLDDLSSACNSIMQLLAGMLMWPVPRELSSSGSEGESNRLQLIYPFLHHKSTSVRLSALQTLGQLVPNFKLNATDTQITLRHLYERGFLELNEEILNLIPSVWQNVLNSAATEDLVVAAGPYVGLWLVLAMAHQRAPVESCHLVGVVPTEEKTFISSSSPDILKVASTRFTLSKLLAALFHRLSDPTVETILISHLNSQSSLQRIIASLIVYFWGQFCMANGTIKKEIAPVQVIKWPPSEQDDLPKKLLENLNNSIYYEEIASGFNKLQNECRDFIATLKHYGVEGSFSSASESDYLSMDQVQYLGSEELQTLINSQVRKGKLIESLSERRRGVNSLWTDVTKEYKEFNTVTLSCQSSALTQFPSHLPASLNSLIKPIINSVRSESNVLYQTHSVKCLAQLMNYLISRSPNPNNKIVQNLVNSIMVEDNGADGDSIESLDKKAEEESIEVRGVKLALIEICRVWGVNLKDSKLWDLSVGVLLKNDSKGTELTTSLYLLTLLTPHFSLELKIIPLLLNTLISKLDSKSSKIRYLASLAIAKFAKVLSEHVMPVIVTDLLPKLEVLDCQVGAMEAVYCIVEELELEILSWIVLLVVPTLGCMSTNSLPARQLASLTFASLIRLLPLESAIPSPPVPSLHSRILQQRDFLEQLLNPSKIPTFNLSIEINADLRPYQKQGVNWLGFLNKYRLNGILCDDMGLGKTLMTICMLGEEHIEKKSCPSMVICPPTLTGHWVYEISKFISSKFLNPLHYHGSPFERQKLQSKLSQHNLVVASYDIVRNDLNFFASTDWHYLVLDEGHVIKNGKTKVSLAIKSLRSKHRLILSGTPIQNNVLELWSLFDFLMPGFLGTEKQFNAKFGRPILQARDNKSSEREQEAGALAMEALHRQTLPFLLRRLKEDVLKDLPPKITQDYYCDLSQLQSKLYEDFARTRAHRSLKDNITHQEKHSHIFQALQYLRKVCNHPKLVLTNGHPQYELIMSSGNIDLTDISHAAKLGALKQLLIDSGIGTPDACSQHRALIFCQLKSMLDIVEEDLLKKHLKSVTYLRLDGSVPAGQRHNLVQRFNNDCSIDLLLLTTQVGGLGLNLTGADTVIFVEHDWNPMRDLQAMDRAHRIGQKKVVNVYRLITRGTLEEKIMGLQKFKLMTANTVISCDNAGLETMATEQLLDLFTLNNSNDSKKKKEASAKKEEELIGAYKNVLESVPELWEEKLYDDEYDLSSFIKSLGK